MLRFKKLSRAYSFAFITISWVFAGNISSPVLAAGPSLTGAVADSVGHPVSGAAVRLSNGMHTVTDAKGRFALEVAPGTYEETIEAARYEPYRSRVTVPTDAQKIVLATSGPSLRLIGSVITHTRAPFNASPVAVKVFPREAYRDQGQPNLASVLAQTPGALPVVSRDANLAVRGVPTYGSVRNALPFETAVSFDGVPLSLPSTGAFDLALIPSFILGDVEIGKGPSDVAGVSPFAIAGELNLRSAEPTATRRALAEVSVESHGGSFDDIAYTGTMPGGKIAIAAMIATDGTSEPLAGNAYSLALDRGATYFIGIPIPSNPDPYHATSLYGCCIAPGSRDLRHAQLLKVHFKPNDALTLTAAYLGSQTARDLAGAEGFILPLAFAGTTVNTFASYAPSLNAREYGQLGLYDLDAQIDHGRDGYDARIYAVRSNRIDSYGTSFDQMMTFNGSTMTGGDITIPNSIEPAPAQQDTISGARIGWQHELGADLLIFSAEARNATSVGDVTGSARDMLANASLQTHPNAKTEIDVGGGLDRHDALGYGWTLGGYRVAASYHPQATLAFRGSFGTSFAPPPLDGLQNVPTGTPFNQYRVGLPIAVSYVAPGTLQPEHATGWDLGSEWRLHGNTTTLSVDLYDTHTDGAFARQIEPIGTAKAYSWFNASPIETQGLEASLVQFKRVGLGFIVQGALARTNRSTDPTVLFSADDSLSAIANAPYAQGYGEISYRWPKGSRLSLGALYLGSNNPYNRPAFATFNSNLELSAGSKGKFQISIENLLNTNADPLPFGYLGENVLAPRTIRIMYRQSIAAGGVLEK